MPKLPEFDDADLVTEARGIAQNHYVRVAFHRWIECYSKMWHHHFEFLMLGYGAYLVFFQFCKQAFPEITDQTVARMVAGIDVLMFRPDDELKRLARLAVELGIDGKFAEGSDPASYHRVARASCGEPGKRWLAELDRSRDPWFNVSTGDGFYHHHRSWNDDLSVPFSALPRYIALIKQGKSLDRPTETLKAERDRITAEYRALLATDAERATFDQMLGLCHLVFPYVEDHKFYCEHWFTTLFFSKIREFGALLAQGGVLDDAEDVFQLQHSEVDEALVDVMLAWAAGVPCAGGKHWKPIVGRRKQILRKAQGLERTARARTDTGKSRGPGSADAVGHHVGKPRGLVETRRRDERERGPRIRSIAGHRRGGRPCPDGTSKTSAKFAKAKSWSVR